MRSHNVATVCVQCDQYLSRILERTASLCFSFFLHTLYLTNSYDAILTLKMFARNITVIIIAQLVITEHLYHNRTLMVTILFRQFGFKIYTYYGFLNFFT